MKPACAFCLPASLLLLLALGGCRGPKMSPEMQLGDSCLKDGRPEEAIIHYQKALELDPALAEAQHSIGDAAVRLYRPGLKTPENLEWARKAIDALTRYLESSPQDTNTQDELIDFCLRSANEALAARFLKAHLSRNPGDRRSHLSFVLLFLRTGHLDDAYQWMDAHELKDPGIAGNLFDALMGWVVRNLALTRSEQKLKLEVGYGVLQKLHDASPEYPQVLGVMSLLSRQQALLEDDEQQKEVLLARAEVLRDNAQAAALRRRTPGAKAWNTDVDARLLAVYGSGLSWTVASPPPPPPPPHARPSGRTR